MAIQTCRIDYFAATVTDQPGEAYKLLSQLERLAGSLHRGAHGADALAAHHLPEYALSLANEAKKAGLLLYGPQPALLVPGDDELGALARIHARLYDGNINVYASSGVADGRGSFGEVICVRPEDYERAASALGVRAPPPGRADRAPAAPGSAATQAPTTNEPGVAGSVVLGDAVAI